MTETFLSLHVIDGGKGGGSFIPFLVAAETEDHAVEKSDAFVESIECLTQGRQGAREVLQAQQDMRALRNTICLIQDPDEIALISRCLMRHNPNIETVLADFLGAVFTVPVKEEFGFPFETVKALRLRMVKHHVLHSLTEDFWQWPTEL